MPENEASAEREQTNESLRVEREKTDRALAERHAAEEDSDSVVHHAREIADAVLTDARAKADERLEASPHVGTDVTLAKERVLEDEALQDERASADESLRRERDENARVLSRLLPLEREKTDRFLLTERVRSDVALSNRDNFLGIVSHDLRNLLGGIVLDAELLSARAPKDEDGAQTLATTARIQRYAARMNRLIGDLIDVASIDAGKLAIAPVPGDAATLIAEAVETFQPAAAAKGISLQTEIVGGPLLAELDHDRMLQVLVNILANAIKFTSQGGGIQVRGEYAGDELRLTISDTGLGIPGNMLEAIFERFWQVGENDRRGVGLGLYISRCIVEAHGGKIWAESKLGEGSRICLTLPVRPGLRAEADETGPATV
ncbi:MAG TPA: HAMP domain-containing sensor histidine kinase [Thermoanaerobaculia bacterium]|jgi:signal transduction histidine kinase|nr:HAMP domain-containing sensor histidine kinase [Thermoanaerobaculia bacterium]